MGDFSLLFVAYTLTWPQHDPNPIVLLNTQRTNCPGFEGFHDENLMTTKNVTTDTILHILVGAAFRPHEANLGLRIPDVGGSSVSEMLNNFPKVIWEEPGFIARSVGILSQREMPSTPQFPLRA